MSSDAARPKQSREFDPVSFTVVPPRRFEDLRVGYVFRAPSRKLAGREGSNAECCSRCGAGRPRQWGRVEPATCA